MTKEGFVMRVDVDYPYPSRAKNFLSTALGINFGGRYLENAKILATMINDSPRHIYTHWFFTTKAMPDLEMLELLKKRQHVIGLHVVNNPEAERKQLKKRIGRPVYCYTVHGTAHAATRLIWKRFLKKAPHIPEDYKLWSWHKFPTWGLDVYCYDHNTDEAVAEAERRIAALAHIHVHPDWLFQRGTLNHRGSYYEALKRILELETSRSLELTTSQVLDLPT